MRFDLLTPKLLWIYFTDSTNFYWYVVYHFYKCILLKCCSHSKLQDSHVGVLPLVIIQYHVPQYSIFDFECATNLGMKMARKAQVQNNEAQVVRLNDDNPNFSSRYLSFASFPD